MEMIDEIFAKVFEMLGSVLGEERMTKITGFFGDAVEFILSLFAK